MNKGLKAAIAVTGAFAGSVAITAGSFLACVFADAKRNYRDGCDYLMVLGGNVIGAETPSPQLKERIKAATDYLKENTACFVVPCGGCFRPEQKKSEALIIAEHLITSGIDKNRIILEDKSTTTFENFKFARKIIENHSGKDINKVSLAFLSSDYHLHRAALIAQRCGIRKIGRVACPTPKEAYKRYLRECVVAYELLLPHKPSDKK